MNTTVLYISHANVWDMARVVQSQTFGMCVQVTEKKVSKDGHRDKCRAVYSMCQDAEKAVM